MTREHVSDPQQGLWYKPMKLFLLQTGETYCSACTDFSREAGILKGEPAFCEERKEAIQIEVPQYPIRRNDL